MIVVTGATGHLGRWVVRRLADRGADLLCLSRRPPRPSPVRSLEPPAPARTALCDLSDPAGVAAAARDLSRAEAVVHLAAEVPDDTARNSPDDLAATLRGNALGTALLLDALRGARELRCVVYASTFEVYGVPQSLPVGEDHPTRPLSAYGASKLAGEKYLALFAAERELPCASLRFPAVYGPGDPTRRAIGNFARAAAAGDDLVVHGDGADRRDLVYAADAAEAISLALERRADGIFNAGSGGATILEMAEAARRAAGGQSRIVHHPRAKERIDYALDGGRARSILGWEARTSLEEGLRAQIEWIREGTGR